MRRLHLIEIHEQPWFPSTLRDQATDALQFGFNLLNAYGPVISLLQRALESTEERAVVDLCSGGGGPWFDLGRKLQGDLPHLEIWLTDKYPNLSAVENVRAASENHIRFYPGPVDATNVPGELQGFRTMFTSFHHFSPEEAGAILQNAVDAREGIGIFEITRRTPSTIALMLAWALILFLCTPWIRPFRWSRLLWTYLIPIIPLVWLFDGIVSCLRTYRPRELREIVATLSSSEYQWEIGELSTGKVPITYLIGCQQPCVGIH
ncbi:MAG: class I SAM-dependent methyltransferase [Acidobacteriia bacterium]|nr:class I SAM-dependent methyltransferase [Terriglobia bacterium]